MFLLLLLLFVTTLSSSTAAAPYRPPLSVWTPPAAAHALGEQQPHIRGEELLSRCKLHWRNATLDHFTYVRQAGCCTLKHATPASMWHLCLFPAHSR